MQGLRRCRPTRRRHRALPGGLETGHGGTGFPDHPADPGKGGVVGPTPEDGTGA